jgi:hypothetical protein
MIICFLNECVQIPLIRAPITWLWATVIDDDFILLSLIASAKTLFSNNVPIHEYWVDIYWGRGHSRMYKAQQQRHSGMPLQENIYDGINMDLWSLYIPFLCTHSGAWMWAPSSQSSIFSYLPSLGSFASRWRYKKNHLLVGILKTDTAVLWLRRQGSLRETLNRTMVLAFVLCVT